MREFEVSIRVPIFGHAMGSETSGEEGEALWPIQKCEGYPLWGPAEEPPLSMGFAFHPSFLSPPLQLFPRRPATAASPVEMCLSSPRRIISCMCRACLTTTKYLSMYRAGFTTPKYLWGMWNTTTQTGRNCRSRNLVLRSREGFELLRISVLVIPSPRTGDRDSQETRAGQ